MGCHLGIISTRSIRPILFLVMIITKSIIVLFQILFVKHAPVAIPIPESVWKQADAPGSAPTCHPPFSHLQNLLQHRERTPPPPAQLRPPCRSLDHWTSKDLYKSLSEVTGFSGCVP